MIRVAEKTAAAGSSRRQELYASLFPIGRAAKRSELRLSPLGRSSQELRAEQELKNKSLSQPLPVGSKQQGALAMLRLSLSPLGRSTGG
eukprot:g67085.t1